jgi:16S rRNA (cytosine1402-N4)-methyltransferase
MSMAAAVRRRPDPPAGHVPVLRDPLLAAIAPVRGLWVDGTFGAGGYTSALLDAGAAQVIAIDRDPSALAAAADWAASCGTRLTLIEGRFGDLDRLAKGAGAAAADGVVLDIGVSSMQLDQAERGFSFSRDGPLDMRMGGAGPSAADLVNRLEDDALADILHQYGEERAARRVARAIVAARTAAPITRTAELARLVSGVLGPPRPGQTHPATRTFQALRIAVNDELGELVRGLEAAERLLAPGGLLAVVTFHSLEDRIVKRFIQLAAGRVGGSRHAPEAAPGPARFVPVTRKAVGPTEAELHANPRARSARLRIASRTAAPARPADRQALGLPALLRRPGAV